MKKRMPLAVILISTFLLPPAVGCSQVESGSSVTTGDKQPASLSVKNKAGVNKEKPMKGLEIYSWQENGKWQYSLVIGTNRNKTEDEIKSQKLDRVERLLKKLEEYPPETQVMWPGGAGIDASSNWELPPAGILEKVKQFCKKAEIKLFIAGGR